jgi:hypothetical protein
MSQYTESPTKTFTASAALGQYLRVKDNGSGKLALAGASDVGLGTMELATFADGEPGTVRLHTAQGTRKMVASEAFATAFATVYAAASGKVATTGTLIVGIAMETASGDDSVFEVLPIPNTDISATITGTNAAVFEADADLAKPRMAIGSQTGGTGDFYAVLHPPTTLTANRVFTLEGDAAATLVNKAGAQTLTDKTLTSPVLTTPLIDDSDAGLTITSADQTSAAATATVPDLGDAADTFVMADTTQTLTNKTLTSPTLTSAANTGIMKIGQTVTPVAAAGSTVADAGQLGSSSIVHITSDSATKGAKLDTGVANQVVFVFNDSATAAELYAASGGTINGLSADASVVVPASKGLLCICTGADTWIAFDMTALATAS